VAKWNLKHNTAPLMQTHQVWSARRMTGGDILCQNEGPAAIGANTTTTTPCFQPPHILTRCHNRNCLCYHFLTLWRGVRAVYGDGLENRSRLYGERGFESHPLRQSEIGSDRRTPSRAPTETGALFVALPTAFRQSVSVLDRGQPFLVRWSLMPPVPGSFQAATWPDGIPSPGQ
jgi:hypothetical protein